MAQKTLQPKSTALLFLGCLGLEPKMARYNVHLEYSIQPEDIQNVKIANSFWLSETETLTNNE